jgi:regulator of nonsense transcripts 2
VDNSDEEFLNGAAVDEDEDVVMLKKREEQVEEDEEFEKEFSRMMSESVESRKFEKKSAMLDVPIPMHLRGGQGNTREDCCGIVFASQRYLFSILYSLTDRRTTAAATNDQTSGKMSFTLLTKKGNRQQAKLMEVPSDSLLAINTRSKQEAEREEQQQLKQIVLNYEEREEANARTGKLLFTDIHALSTLNSNQTLYIAAAEDRKQRFAQRPRRILHIGGGGGDAYTSERFVV